MKYIIDIQEVEEKKILLLTGLSIWAVLGMDGMWGKAEDTSAKNSDSNQELAQQHQASSEEPSTKKPDPDWDGICSPWVSQNGVMDEYRSLCDGIDKCPDQAGSVDADGCP